MYITLSPSLATFFSGHLDWLLRNQFIQCVLFNWFHVPVPAAAVQPIAWEVTAAATKRQWRWYSGGDRYMQTMRQQGRGQQQHETRHNWTDLLFKSWRTQQLLLLVTFISWWPLFYSLIQDDERWGDTNHIPMLLLLLAKPIQFDL